MQFSFSSSLALSPATAAVSGRELLLARISVGKKRTSNILVIGQECGLYLCI